MTTVISEVCNKVLENYGLVIRWFRPPEMVQHYSLKTKFMFFRAKFLAHLSCIPHPSPRSAPQASPRH